MATYNPFEDLNPAFTRYEYLRTPEVEKVTIKDPLYDSWDLPTGFSRVADDGTYIAEPNTPETSEFDKDILSRMASTHAENTFGYSSINPNIGERPRQAVQFFVDNGYTVNQAKGIVGNLMHESGDPTLMNITNKGDKGTSFGMAQWHDTSKGKGRWTNLKNFARELGKSEDDFETQLKFVLKELKDNQSWDRGLRATTTIEGATKWFMNNFERPAQAAAAFQNRLKYANSLS